MNTLEGVTMNIEFCVGFQDNSNNAGPTYEDDWGHKRRHLLPSYWKGQARISDKTDSRSIIFTLSLSNKLPDECCGTMTHGEKLEAISNSKLGFMESLFRFRDWLDGDAVANQSELNEVIAKAILEKLGVEMMPKQKFPLPHLSELLWLDLKPLLDNGTVVRPNYQMEMLT